jgi:hypothetical protein
MPLIKFFCCLDVYLKLYLIFLGFVIIIFYINSRFSFLICMDVVSHYIFFDLYDLFFV